MLIVKPIQSKDEQRELCEECSVEFLSDAFAYRADDGDFIGICQFTFENNVGYIKNLAYCEGQNDNEAMTIMLRTAMNFMYRCGITDSYLADCTLNDELLRMSAYKRDDKGQLYINLKEFYEAPCKHH